MKNIKKLLTKTSILTLLGVLALNFYACGGSEPVTSPEPAETIIADGRLVFTGTADNGLVRFEFFNNYLETILDGNPHNNSTTPVPLVSTTHTLPFELSLTGFTYYEEAVDIHCAKNIYTNKVNVNVSGSIPNGNQAVYAVAGDGVFYVCDQTTYANFCAIGAYYELQGPQDEIDTIKVLPAITYNPKYTCIGSDDNEYELALYGEYDEAGLSLNTSFDFMTNKMTGVLSVKRKNYNDKPVVIFVQ
jgi:hypothetical protein